MVTRIERPRSRLCVFLLGISFLAVFIILLGIGDGAPKVLLAQEDRNGILRYEGGINTYTTDVVLSKEHQLFWMDLQLGTGEGLLVDFWPVTMEVDLDVYVTPIDVNSNNTVESYKVQATQFCPEEVSFCNYFFLLKRDFVDHDGFRFGIEFRDPPEYLHFADEDHSDNLYEVRSRVTSINPEFTRFEIAFKYLWLILTLFVMFCPCGVGFLSALKRQRRDTGVGRNFHQKWTAVLLWALVWFDEPFLWATVYTGWAKVFSAVFILSASIFVFLIMLFWLCFLSDLRFMQNGEGIAGRGICYWIPKLVLTLAIGATMLGGYMYYRFENTLSFEYTGVDDEKKAAETLAGLLGFLLAVYMLWTIVLGLRSCGSLRRVSPSYVLLYCITLLACLVAVIGVFVAAYYPYSTSGVAFVGIHGLLNLYVWTLAISFSPVRTRPASGGDSNSLGMGDKSGGAAVTGTRGGADSRHGDDVSGWEGSADGDFKAVEL